MKEEKMVALWGRTRGFSFLFIPCHHLDHHIPMPISMNRYMSNVVTDKGWEFSTMMLKARFVAETLIWELLGQGHFLNPHNHGCMDGCFIKWDFFQRILSFCIHSIDMMFALLFIFIEPLCILWFETRGQCWLSVNYVFRMSCFKTNMNWIEIN